MRDKQKLVDDLRKAEWKRPQYFARITGLCWSAIEQLRAGSLERLQRVDDAVNALISPDALRRDFFGFERLVTTLYNAVKPNPAALEFAARAACLTAIASAIRTKLNPNPADISRVLGQVGKLLDDSITGIAMAGKGAHAMDLSKN